MRTRTVLGKKQQDKVKVDARMISASESDFKRCNEALVEKLFSDKDEVTVEDFMKIKRGLTESLLHYEFSQFDQEDGTISAIDFAKSLLSTLSWGKANMYLKRIN